MTEGLETEDAGFSKCGAKKKNGSGNCTKPAGWGTGHPGHGRCKLHGGSSPSGSLAAAKSVVQSFGIQLDVDPHEALLTCLRISAGQLAYATDRVNELQPDMIIGRKLVTTEEAGYSGEKGEHESSKTEDQGPDLHIWIRVQQECLDRTAKLAKLALDAGVEERRVRIAEETGQLFAGAIRGILADLGVADDPRAPAIVRTHLTALESQT